MNVRARILALVVILILAVLPLFAGTRIVFRSVLTGIPMPTITTILIVGLTDNYLLRQEFEDTMEELLAKSGVTVIKSHQVFPPRNEVMATTFYIKESTVVRAERNIYNSKDQKLLWSGASDTLLEKSFEKMGQAYAQTLYNQLKKDKVIPKK